ncbi:MAG: hydrogenase maturation protease [Ignavibacteriales bacterium]|nr:hydrogenase maturation protease [Ignavibacteriales bacterium]
MCERTLVVGVGNPMRGDDAIGLLVAGQLRSLSLPEVAIIEHNGDGAALMERWKGFDRVVVVDAVRAEKTPGTVVRFDAGAKPVRAEFATSSSHAFGIGEAIELARMLEELPPSLTVLGVVGKEFRINGTITPEVARAAESVVKQVILEVQHETRDCKMTPDGR